MRYRRIMIFSSSAYVYGAERGLLLLIKWLLRKRLVERVTVVLPHPGPLQDNLAEFPDVEVITSLFPYVWGSDWKKTWVTMFWLPLTFLYFVALACRRRVNVLISNTSFVSVSLPLAFFFPHFFFARECFPQQKWFTRYQRALSFVSRKVFAVSQYVKNAVRVEKAHLIHEPIDASFYRFYPPEKARKKLGVKDSAHVVSIVGRIHPAKGQAEFLSLLASLRGRLKEETTVLIAGDSPEQSIKTARYKQRIQQILDEHPDLRHVVMLGYVDDVGAVYSASDLCVFPHTRKEFYGFSLLEALFYKKAVLVASAEGGVEEYVPDPSAVAPLNQDTLVEVLSLPWYFSPPEVEFPRMSEYVAAITTAFSHEHSW